MNAFVAGVLFASLWASASIATKFGIHSAEPLVLAVIRFLIAGILLTGYCHAVKQYDLPKQQEWRELAVLGLLNTTLYLGCFYVALQTVSAGLATLFIAANPLLITVFSAVWLKREIRSNEWTGIVCGTVGLLLTTIPALQNHYATLTGVVVLFCGMIFFSIGSIQIARSPLVLANVTINAWQVLIGGILLAPIALLFNDITTTTIDLNLAGSLLWLIVAVSIGAMQLWFYLLKIDAVQAGLWLLLTPILGYAFSAFFLQEPITIDVVAGSILVIVGLRISKR